MGQFAVALLTVKSRGLSAELRTEWPRSTCQGRGCGLRALTDALSCEAIPSSCTHFTFILHWYCFACRPTMQNKQGHLHGYHETVLMQGWISRYTQNVSCHILNTISKVPTLLIFREILLFAMNFTHFREICKVLLTMSKLWPWVPWGTHCKKKREDAVI